MRIPIQFRFRLLIGIFILFLIISSCLIEEAEAKKKFWKKVRQYFVQPAIAAGLGALTGGAGAVILGANVASAATAGAITSAIATAKTKDGMTVYHDTAMYNKVDQHLQQQQQLPTSTFNIASSSSNAHEWTIKDHDVYSRLSSEALNRAKLKSQNDCATFVRESIDSALNIKLERQQSAKDYGKSLLNAGFKQVNDAVRIGDVRILQPYPGGNPNGHMQMYTTEGWVSDFMQRDEWAGPGYRQHKPEYATYRYQQ